MPDIIVVGDVDTDIYMRVSHIPTWDEGVLAEEVLERPGGKGGNTAAALSRLGNATGILASVGNDRYGDIARKGLARHAVDTSQMVVVPDGQTYYCIALLDPTGEKALVVVRTPLTFLDPEQLALRTDYLTAAKHVHFIGTDPDRINLGVKIAHDAGKPVSIDVDAAYGDLETFENLFINSTLVFINEQGITRLYPNLSENKAIEEIHQLGPDIVVLTKGSKGSVGYDGETFISCPAFDVAVVDTTGAGDTFSAGFVHGYVRGWSLSKNLEFGSAAAALSTFHIGAQESLPTEQEVFAFIDKDDK